VIVWLASFPRSGNTLTRALFKRCFDIDTYEHYNNRSRLWSNDRVAEQVGHVYYQGDWKRFHRHAWSADETFFIKTHGAPIDNQKSVYIVRDGRAATYSYFEFLRDFTGQPLSLAEVIAGHGPFGSWSEHVQMWHGRENGPPSLLVRFEDILSSPDQVVEEISDFIGVPVRQRFENKFSEMQSEMPRFFRRGDNSDATAGYDKLHRRLFDLFHGEQMYALGYAESRPELADLRDCLLDLQFRQSQAARRGLIDRYRFRRDSDVERKTDTTGHETD
jgi:hypothetical protein